MTGDCSSDNDLRCDLLAPLVAKHGWGSPIDKDSLIGYAPIATDQEGDAKNVFEELRQKPFITDCGNRGIKINTSRQGDLATFLEEVCEWPEVTIDRRLKHYEGYKDR